MKDGLKTEICDLAKQNGEIEGQKERYTELKFTRIIIIRRSWRKWRKNNAGILSFSCTQNAVKLKSTVICGVDLYCSDRVIHLARLGSL